MAKFENNILGLIPNVDWLKVGFQVNRPNDPIDAIMGDMKTDNLVAQWEVIASQYQIPVMANFHAFDTEARKTFRIPIDQKNIEKGLIKVKLNQSERLRALIGHGVQNEGDLYDYVLNDGFRLADQVFTRSKVAKNELLATGKVTIKENNLDLTVDYGVGDSQKSDLDLASDANVFEQMQEVIDTALAAGVTLTGIITSRKLLSKLRVHPSVQRAINGNYMVGATVRMSALEDYLAAELGITKIIVNDQVYGVDGGFTDGRPVVTSKRYFPEDKMTFFSTNAGGQLGVGLWGNPPEIDAANFYTGNASAVSPYVYVTQHAEWDPAVIWTKATGLFMPVLYNPYSLWIVTAVDEEDSSGE